MNKNVGKADRIVRLVLAIAIGVLFITEELSIGAMTVLGIIGVIFLVTALIGTCPLYMLTKISTNKGSQS
ncbi:DUF2892 domain-containing protein [Candidatus Neomarinimicrobiota bacterium]